MFWLEIFLSIPTFFFFLAFSAAQAVKDEFSGLEKNNSTEKQQLNSTDL